MHYYILIYLWDKVIRKSKPLLLTYVFSKVTLCSMAFLKNEKMKGRDESEVVLYEGTGRGR